MTAVSDHTSHRTSAGVPLPLRFCYMYDHYKWNAHQAVSSYPPWVGHLGWQGVKAEHFWMTGPRLILTHSTFPHASSAARCEQAAISDECKERTYQASRAAHRMPTMRVALHYSMGNTRLAPKTPSESPSPARAMLGNAPDLSSSRFSMPHKHAKLHAHAASY